MDAGGSAWRPGLSTALATRSQQPGGTQSAGKGVILRRCVPVTRLAVGEQQGPSGNSTSPDSVLVWGRGRFLNSCPQKRLFRQRICSDGQIEPSLAFSSKYWAQSSVARQEEGEASDKNKTPARLVYRW